MSIEPSYRYYHQDESRYYAPAFDEAQAFQTSDSDLGDFSGQKVGLRVVLPDRPWPRRNSDFDFGLHYYHRDDDIDMFWLMFGISFPY
ncbi:MAG: DUF3570 domain-containing protein [Halioglobus sp.]|nr:DUF3570 domain-containing protein [Halioglobus sp.]